MKQKRFDVKKKLSLSKLTLKSYTVQRLRQIKGGATDPCQTTDITIRETACATNCIDCIPTELCTQETDPTTATGVSLTNVCVGTAPTAGCAPGSRTR
jgi:hypothetical protein